MRDDGPPDDVPFSGLEASAPPSELREKVLALAREALAEEAVRDVWTQIWESRPLRLAWAVAASFLVIANIRLEPVRPPGAAVLRPGVQAAREAARELSAFVALPPIDETVRPLAGRTAADASSPERKPSTPRGGMS